MDLYNQRQDLTQKLSSFGADIPTTSMHRKRQGNHLEWIVRQMSWAAPWTSTGKDETKKTFASKAMPVHHDPYIDQASDAKIHTDDTMQS